MKLKVLLPTAVFMDMEVRKVIAEAENGAFCLLPRHRDLVTALVPGLISLTTVDGQEVFLAVDEGILVKCGAEVLVSTRQAVQGPDLGSLRRTIDEQFGVVDEHEKLARAAVARLEADLARRFLELQDHGT
jgi:F-type H+-transporting ATPase subunit epsilon